jgi:signal transduction histidine kinase
VIQPYIGLQFGLTAIDRRLAEGDTDVRGDIKRLIAQIGKVVDGLRNYMRGLQTPGERESILVPAVRRFAATFTETTGIDVHIKTVGDLRVNDRLAAEVFQMVTEGLSNVRRHTHAMQARVVLARRDNYLVLRIEDAGANGSTPAPFTPRSISERAGALGGRVRVDRREDGGNAVVVEIPL